LSLRRDAVDVRLDRVEVDDELGRVHCQLDDCGYALDLRRVGETGVHLS
jgi:hypothetical protein